MYACTQKCNTFFEEDNNENIKIRKQLSEATAVRATGSAAQSGDNRGGKALCLGQLISNSG